MLVNGKNALLASENAILHIYLQGCHFYKTGNFNSKIKVKNEKQVKNQVLK